MDAKVIQEKLKEHSSAILGSEKFSKYAVLLPLVQKNNETHVLFEVRSHKLRRQPGEICFPGGRIDRRDENDEACAIRETGEELGIKHDQISGVFPLDYVVSPFGMIVYPHAGFIHDIESITPNPPEVGEVFTVPLSYLLKTPPKVYHVDVKVKPEDNFPFDLIAGGQDYNWRTGKIDEYFYFYEDRVIWGLTAKILAHFVDVIQ
ncbi:coenzyme A pyrophosphatase [Virgibacillus phasianinus]|uniref:Coenzyme A pyrophosphatase n=1 Tax=Virgibacillus phasianinus TaxID=2017483 RepID=A0A220U1F7_9BACI|nr:CoA pyrophosphatase [Virgibacillus phasianinus]ASK61842.1 coenzyme A pyrophosphatase [Virgibacillus phasianinus]